MIWAHTIYSVCVCKNSRHLNTMDGCLSSFLQHKIHAAFSDCNQARVGPGCLPVRADKVFLLFFFCVLMCVCVCVGGGGVANLHVIRGQTHHATLVCRL